MKIIEINLNNNNLIISNTIFLIEFVKNPSNNSYLINAKNTIGKLHMLTPGNSHLLRVHSQRNSIGFTSRFVRNYNRLPFEGLTSVNRLITIPSAGFATFLKRALIFADLLRNRRRIMHCARDEEKKNAHNKKKHCETAG